MGNSKVHSIIPSVISKNWQQLSASDFIFQNKLTSQRLRQFNVLIQDDHDLQQLKNRLYQTNPYICKVLFYCQISTNQYRLYIEDIKNKIFIHNIKQWKGHKKNIISTFVSLSKIYGLTHVCHDMIGIDSSGQIKVWINPDLSASKAWKSCNSESEMIYDILETCRQIYEESSQGQHNKQAKIKLQKSTNVTKSKMNLNSQGRLVKQRSTSRKRNLEIKKMIYKFSSPTLELKKQNLKQRRQQIKNSLRVSKQSCFEATRNENKFWTKSNKSSNSLESKKQKKRNYFQQSPRSEFDDKHKFQPWKANKKDKAGKMLVQHDLFFELKNRLNFKKSREGDNWQISNVYIINMPILSQRQSEYTTARNSLLQLEQCSMRTDNEKTNYISRNLTSDSADFPMNDVKG